MTDKERLAEIREQVKLLKDTAAERREQRTFENGSIILGLVYWFRGAAAMTREGVA